MNELHLFDETFDKNQSHNYHLSIQSGMNGLSFCLLDTVRNKYIGFHHYPSQSNEYVSSLIPIIQADPVLTLSYKSVSHMFVDGRNTLVPTSLFDAKKAAMFYQLSHGQSGCSEILSNQLDNAMAVNIFTYPPDFLIRLKEIYPGIKTFHRSSPFVEALVLHSAKWIRSKCYVSISKSEIDIGIAQMKKLEFYNSFTYKENSDIVYYLLNVLERFKLSNMLTEVYISADVENHDELFEFLNNYFNLIKFIRPSDQYLYSYMFDELQLTRFANLFNLALCES
jgi:hypothetical protein